MQGWTTRGFIEAFDSWCALEAPAEDLRVVALHWVMTRSLAPYQGVRRVDGFANLWFGVVPETRREGRVVTCQYWIYEAERELRCDLFGTLSLPV